MANPENNQFKLKKIRKDSKNDIFNKVNLIEHLMYFNLPRVLTIRGKWLELTL